MPTLTLNVEASSDERAEAQHIRQAFLVPEDTKPYMSAKKVPGKTAKDPLHRTVSTARIDKNRILDGVDGVDGFIVKIVS
ncbi:hypothetical protein ACF1HJ_41665 [Streptomyces sp. NPDC013978]|uniref:hypothetical protein n=1 Tax=Streptomyces sp. NPDC013978 TaxID=3364869 RepID=UPI0036FEBFBA